ncbi:sugar ABC transporter permease [Chelativorans sp. AA-79]|uniref:carbohydrate ABC transporter permease n=1 Tax=Chelativorans sp. AA-79 TaxID=3028735 RepID=UPI0023F7F556|nr:sugar ABC transporter permease [Chelativorans sp. AA-79]WEX08673.1 sugar ABC transporter permease [Chelativorans sp. AA-79]
MAEARQIGADGRLRSTAAAAGDEAPAAARPGRGTAHDRWFRYGTLLPAVVLLLMLTVYPTVNLLMMSVSTIDFVQGGQVWNFTPARNFGRLLNDHVFAIALKNTLIFVVVTVVAEMVLGFALALLVSGAPRAKGIVRTLMILPILVPPVAIGSMWKLMYNYDFGIFNQALAVFGAMPLGWLSDPRIALASVILVDIWHWTPFVFLILFAGVEGLPKEVLEAARVDGATTWQTIRKVIIPLMMPSIAVAFLFRTIFAFKVFDEVYLLTSGGPGTATEVVSLHLYKVFFEQNNLGYGALLSLVIIVAIVTFLATARRFAPEAR